MIARNVEFQRACSDLFIGGHDTTAIVQIMPSWRGYMVRECDVANALYRHRTTTREVA